MNIFQPSTWTAKAQASFAALLTAIAVATAVYFKLPDAIVKSIAALGALVVAAIAHIDNGEVGPNNPQEPPAPDEPMMTPMERAVLTKFGKLSIVLAATLCLAGCSTGIGRATSLAFSGVPPSVAVALDSAEAEYDLRANYQMTDIVASEPQTPEGVLAQENARASLEARMDAEHAIFDSLRQYVGVEKGAAPTATQDAAAKTRTATLEAALAKIATMKLKAAAKAEKPPAPKKEE